MSRSDLPRNAIPFHAAPMAESSLRRCSSVFVCVAMALTGCGTASLDDLAPTAITSNLSVSRMEQPGGSGSRLVFSSESRAEVFLAYDQRGCPTPSPEILVTLNGIPLERGEGGEAVDVAVTPPGEGSGGARSGTSCASYVWSGRFDVPSEAPWAIRSQAAQGKVQLAGNATGLPAVPRWLESESVRVRTGESLRLAEIPPGLEVNFLDAFTEDPNSFVVVGQEVTESGNPRIVTVTAKPGAYSLVFRSRARATSPECENVQRCDFSFEWAEVHLLVVDP